MEGELIVLNVPSALEYMDKIEVDFDAELFDERRWAIDIWHGEVRVRGNGQDFTRRFSGFGDYIGFDGTTASGGLGFMGHSDVTITAELWAEDLGSFHFIPGLPPPSSPIYRKVASETFLIEAVQNGDGNGGYEPPDDDGDEPPNGDEFGLEDFPWKWAGIAVAGLFAGLVIRRIRE